MPTPSLRPGLVLIFLAGCLVGCANFRRLSRDLRFIDRTDTVMARLSPMPDDTTVYGLALGYDSTTQKVHAVDGAKVGTGGVFGFFVKRNTEQYLMAFADQNDNESYDPGEPAWIHTDGSGKPAPVLIDPFTHGAMVQGQLSTATRFPESLVAAAHVFKADRAPRDIVTGWNIPVELGTLARVEEPRFSSDRGSRGYWEPASYPIESGVGIFFLENYDVHRIPILFVYGAAGSLQDWRPFLDHLDRSRYQAWFFHYPTGAKLDVMGSTLNSAIQLLHEAYGFRKMHVVAHSMGGLVSRDFLLKNRRDGHSYVHRFVSISTPWGGQEFARSGVRRAPSVIPSWYDLVPNSTFQQRIFSESISGKTPHLLLYGHRSQSSLVLPAENDGTVSVASETHPQAVADAVEVRGYDEGHVSILSNQEVIRRTFQFFDQDRTASSRH
ncbi:hypothetical protein HNR46_003413 [Haloferula luteola]|uniref:Alpha/beta hydrolase family protein n=1 Tax=Haloferula luteola TaxID=595692 RepID=A0A840VH60_9BACT|nr:alpha/beta fold hydrolase [Haloferula luteola]MBB5353159.1 hypothetical protein [Haloferula luteola]